MTLSWFRPQNTGRSDFYYVVQYSDGDTAGQHTLVDEMYRAEEVISGLVPDTAYTFTVTVHNGVTDQDVGNEHLRRCELTATTREGSKKLP